MALIWDGAPLTFLQAPVSNCILLKLSQDFSKVPPAFSVVVTLIVLVQVQLLLLCVNWGWAEENSHSLTPLVTWDKTGPGVGPRIWNIDATSEA